MGLGQKIAEIKEEFGYLRADIDAFQTELLTAAGNIGGEIGAELEDGINSMFNSAGIELNALKSNETLSQAARAQKSLDISKKLIGDAKAFISENLDLQVQLAEHADTCTRGQPYKRTNGSTGATETRDAGVLCRGDGMAKTYSTEEFSMKLDVGQSVQRPFYEGLVGSIEGNLNYLQTELNSLKPNAPATGVQQKRDAVPVHGR